MQPDYTGSIRSLRLFKNKKLSIKQLQGGLTNISFLVGCERKKYVVRFAPTSYRTLGIDKNAEVHNTKLAARLGVGPGLFVYDAKKSVTVVDYLPGRPVTTLDLRQPKILARTVEVLKKLHTSKHAFVGELNIYNFIITSLANAQKNTSALHTEITNIKKELLTIKRRVGKLLPPVPCHLDMLLGNIILNRNQIKLIDWEYAASSDWRFDLAMLSVMARFTKSQDRHMLAAYGLPSAPWLSDFKRLVHMRECVWGMNQWVSKSNKPLRQSFYLQYLQKHLRQAVKK